MSHNVNPHHIDRTEMRLLTIEAYLDAKTILTLATLVVCIIPACIKFSRNVEDQEAFKETQKWH